MNDRCCAAVAANLTILLSLTVIMTGCAPAESELWESAYQSLNVDDLRVADEKVVACMSDSGWPGFVAVEGGGIEYPPLAEEQLDVARAALSECSATVRGGGARGPSSVDIEALYHHELAALACLAKLGYQPEEPPSFQRYLDLHGSEEHWSAYGSIADQISGSGEFRKASNTCPDPGWFSGSLPTPK